VMILRSEKLCIVHTKIDHSLIYFRSDYLFSARYQATREENISPLRRQ
jgi:hypothetical protein